MFARLHPVSLLACALLFTPLATRGAVPAPETLYESPGGAFHIVSDDAPRVIFKGNPRPVPLPGREKNELQNPDDAFHASPDEHWLFALHHVGSGLCDGNLFHVTSPSEVTLVKKAAPFSQLAWENGRKLGALQHNYSAEGLYAMTFFVGWSPDSVRLLIRLGGGEWKGAFTERFIYFNTWTQTFEVTDYLRRLNKLSELRMACAEPLTPLPDETALQKRYAESDATLNQVYRAKLPALEKTASDNLRQDQREWLRERDAGVAPYVSSFSAEEKERRRLQYLAAVTAARVESVRWYPHY
jgi:uncharacterized protein YecT (DUF1311 family)